MRLDKDYENDFAYHEIEINENIKKLFHCRCFVEYNIPNMQNLGKGSDSFGIKSSNFYVIRLAGLQIGHEQMVSFP